VDLQLEKQLFARTLIDKWLSTVTLKSRQSV
jgi:hypothetical protein